MTEYPELAESFRKEGYDRGLVHGAENELKRIQAIESLAKLQPGQTFKLVLSSEKTKAAEQSGDGLDLISLREYARRHGVTLGAVQKAIASGRVTAVKRNERGFLCGIFEGEANKQWAANTDQMKWRDREMPDRPIL